MVAQERERITKSLLTAVIAVYLVGLLLSHHRPLRPTSMIEYVVRPDVLLSIPLLFVAVRRRLRLAPAAVAALLYVCVLAVSMLVNRMYDPTSALTFLLQSVYVVGLFVVLSSLDIDRERLLFVFRVWCGLLVVAALFGIYQALVANLGVGLSPTVLGGSLAPTFGSYIRPASVFSEPNWFTTFLLTGIPILLGSVATNSFVIFGRGREVVMIGILTLAVLLSGSFGGYFTLLGLVGCGLVVPDTRRFTVKTVVAISGPGLIVLGVLATLSPANVSFIFTRIGVIGGVFSDIFLGSEQLNASSSAEVRAVAIILSLLAWRSGILFGVGPGQMKPWAAVNELQTGVTGVIAYTGGPTNYWLHALAHGGLLGLGALLWLWKSVLSSLYRQYVTGTERPLVVAGLLLVATQAIDGLWGIQTLHPIRWVFLAIIYAYLTGPESGL